MRTQAVDFTAVDKYIHDHIRDWMEELSGRRGGCGPADATWL